MSADPNPGLRMRLLRRLSPALVPVVALFGLGGLVTHNYWAPDGVVIPAPATDLRAGSDTTATVVLAGGCFWGVQAVFQHTKGVTSAVSGYAGGEEITAKYELVGSGLTGHAESVQVTYDPRVISYGKILHIFFSVAHDPTEIDRQGPDVGTEYRTTIFPMNDEQARVAKAYISQLNDARLWGSPIATTVEPSRTFYPAEAYHQDFLEHNRTYPYIVINDLPKLADLKRLFPREYREDAVLVKP